MKERPILFSGPMVRAILEGRKTQTRRVVKPQPELSSDCGIWYPNGYHPRALHYAHEAHFRKGFHFDWANRFGKPGDRLWVRETWAPMCRNADPVCYCEEMPAYLANPAHYIEYRADTGNPRPGDWPEPEDGEFEDAHTWKPSIHMRREFSRINLEITSVRVERLQEISEEDARAEGYPTTPSPDTLTQSGMDSISPKRWFSEQWSRIHGYSHDPNVWVWVIKFRRLP